MYHLRVEVFSVDMEEKSKDKKTKKKATKAEKKENPLTEQIEFFSGNPSVEVTEGIVHLYIHREDRPASNSPEVSFSVLPVRY